MPSQLMRMLRVQGPRLACMCARARLYPTPQSRGPCVRMRCYTQLCNPVDCRPPDSSVHGILRARILEWLSFPSPSCVAAAAKSLQSCPTLCDPIDGSPSGSPVPRILQERILEAVLRESLLEGSSFGVGSCEALPFNKLVVKSVTQKSWTDQ